MEFSGRLTTIRFGDVLQLAHQERWSGALVVRRSRREKRLYLEDGQVVGCLSDDPGEYYGRHLLLAGYLEEGEVARALRWRNENDARLGEAVVELGLLSEEEVRGSLASRIADSVCDVFLWRRGVFYLQNDRMPPQVIPPRPLDVFALVMEGTRWIDEEARIWSVLKGDQAILDRGPAWPPPEDLPPLATRVAWAVDGERDLASLHGQIGGVRFRFLEAAYRLCLDEVLDIVELGFGDISTTAEVSLVDVLMEQGSREERALLGERHFSIPVDVLVELVPAWAASGGADDRDGYDAGDRRFLDGIDGRRPIRELLSTAGEERSRQFELLLVELRRGRLALLPGSVRDTPLVG